MQATLASKRREETVSGKSEFAQGLVMVFAWFKSAFKRNDDNVTEHDKTTPRDQPLVDLKLPQLKFFTDSIEFAIPFKISEAALEEWFNSLDPGKECYFACQQVFRAVKALNNRKMQPAQRFALLDFIAIALIPVIKRLEQPILERKISLSIEARRHHELIVATYAVLAQGFSLVAAEIAAARVGKHNEQLLVRALFDAMEALKKILLYAGEVYEQPYEGFWSSCYRLYRCAEQYDLLDLSIKDGTIRENAGVAFSIDYSFKSLLVFYLSGINQYKPKTMKTLVNIFMIWAPYAKIYKKIDQLSSKLFFVFSLSDDAPPVFLGRFNKRSSDLRYINTTEVAKIVYDNLRNKTAALLDVHTMKRQELVQLVKNLSMGTHRKFMRIPENKHYSGLIGYDNILRYLRDRANGNLDGEAAAGAIAGQRKIPDLELLPLIDYEKAFGSKGWSQKPDDYSGVTHSDAIWNPEDSGQPAQFDTLQIVNSSVKGYGVVCSERHAKAEIGEYIGILADDETHAARVEIGIIRRISQTGSNGVSLGVELFSSAAEAVRLHTPENALLKKWAILLRGIDAVNLPDSIIYESEDFKFGDEICLLQGDKTVRARFGNLLHSSTALRHAEILIQPDADY
ncbi:MAG: hypothetical protein ACU837_09090 [Gammaproteobacteria bacterium]